jgi:hypothetical protein
MTTTLANQLPRINLTNGGALHRPVEPARVFGNNSLNLSKSRLSGLGSYWGVQFGLAGMISTKPASSNTFGSRKTTARGGAANVVRRLRYV